MSYIPVGTRLDYTAQLDSSLINGFSGAGSLESIISRLKSDLLGLPGLEELDIENSHGTPSLGGVSTIFLTLLNNGVDHGDENDVKSIVDGTLQNEGIPVIGSNIIKIVLPNNPEDNPDNAPTTIITGATPNNPSTAPSSTSVFGNLFQPSLSTKFLTTGTIIIIAIIALVLLLPKGALSLARGVRR